MTMYNGGARCGGPPRLLQRLTLAGLFPVMLGLGGGSPEPDAAYYVYVAAESEDRVDVVRFDAEGAGVLRSIPVGLYPTEIDGPHGMAVSPDGSTWFVTIAHGNPFGRLYAYATADDRQLGYVELGLFPASMQMAATGLLYAVNFNLHGDPAPGTVSVVDVASMTEIGQVETCVKPHGSRLSTDGSRLYTVCVGSEQLVEIDAYRLAVARRMALTPGAEAPLADGEEIESVGGGPVCSPTWAHPSPDGAHVFVACNKNAEVLEIDTASWEVSRRFATGPGPYNLDVTADGRLLIVTYKGGQATGIWRLDRGEELGRVENTRRLPHGIALTPDSKYAFISVEGVGGEPGTVDVIELETARKVASVDVGKQAGGIVFWKMEPR